MRSTGSRPAERARQPDGAHGRLRARVGEAPLRQCPAPRQLLGHQHGVLARRGEMGALRAARGQRGADGRVGVALHHGAEAVVEVDVLVAVHVPHARPLAAREVDRPGLAGLERGRDAAGQHAAGPLEQPPRLGRALGQVGALALEQRAGALGEHRLSLMLKGDGYSASSDEAPSLLLAGLPCELRRRLRRRRRVRRAARLRTLLRARGHALRGRDRHRPRGRPVRLGAVDPQPVPGRREHRGPPARPARLGRGRGELRGGREAPSRQSLRGQRHRRDLVPRRQRGRRLRGRDPGQGRRGARPRDRRHRPRAVRRGGRRHRLRGRRQLLRRGRGHGGVRGLARAAGGRARARRGGRGPRSGELRGGPGRPSGRGPGPHLPRPPGADRPGSGHRGGPQGRLGGGAAHARHDRGGEGRRAGAGAEPAHRRRGPERRRRCRSRPATRHRAWCGARASSASGCAIPAS